MKDLPLNTLRAFAAVYETGGIRPAGRRLGVTHSSISRHLRELEKWIGTDLFLETVQGGSLVFSSQGEKLGRAVLSSMAELEKAVSSVRETKRANSVTISTTPSFAMRWLLPVLPAFETENPAIEISVLVDQKTRPPEEEGSDIAIRMGEGPWPQEYCQRLMGDELFPVMGHDYWQKHGCPDRMDQLAGLRLLHDRDPNTHWDLWKRAYGPDDLHTNAGSRFTSSDLLLRAAEQNMGVALVRHRLAKDSLKAGTVVRPFGDSKIELENAYWLIQTWQSKRRKAVQITVDWLKTRAEEEG